MTWYQAMWWYQVRRHHDVVPDEAVPGEVAPDEAVPGSAALIAGPSLIRLPPCLGSEQTYSSQTHLEFLFMWVISNYLFCY